MAEELTLGQAHSSDDDDNDEPSKAELQRRMEEARETITQTVTEIKETVTNQYYSMKESVSDALDWRHHFRNNPIAFSVGALSVGFLVGYGITGALKSDGRGGDDEDYPSSEETDVYARVNASPARYEDESEESERRSAFHGHSYAAQPITDQLDETSGGERDYAPAAGGSLSYSAPREERDETPQKPGLYERFKETSAYDRLQTEVSTLGDRFMEELSSTAHNVVLPALFNKLKELFGVDLTGKQNQQAQSNQSSAQTNAPETNTGARAASASASSASSSLASASRGSSDSSYATSENRGYGTQGAAGETNKGGEGSSVLDLDR